MNRKVLGIIGVLAVGVVDAGASCPGYNGGYIGLKFGTAVQTAKHKKAEKKVKVKEDATYVLKEAYFDKAGLEAAVQSVHDAQIPDPAVAFPDALFNAAVVGAGDHNLLNAPVPDLAVFNAGMSALLAAKIAAAKAAFGIADDQIVLPVFTDVQQGSRVISAGSVSGYEIFSAQGTQAAPENFNGTAARVVVTAATVCRTQFLTDVFGGDTAAAIGTKFNERFDRIVFHAADDFYKAAENGEAKDQVRDFTVPESKCQAHKQAGLIELEAGFCKSCNKFLFSVGIFGEFSTGKCGIKATDSVESKTFDQFGEHYKYDTNLVRPDSNISVKQNYTFGLRFAPGFTLGNCRLYFPLELGYSRFVINFDRSEEAIKAFAGKNPTRSGNFNVDGVVKTADYILRDVTVDGADANTANSQANSVIFKKNKSKILFGLGIGGGIKISKNVSFDVCATLVPSCTLTVDTPAYESNSLVDVSRLGETHEIKVQSLKIKVGFTYLFS